MGIKIPKMKGWKDFWSYSNGNLLTNKITTWPSSMSHCDIDTKVVLCIAACSSRPTDSLFDKSLHASHDEKQIILMFKEMIQALYENKDIWSAMASILNCSKTTEPGYIERRGEKRTRNQTASLKPKTVKPRKDETGNTVNLGKYIRTFFKPTASKPKKLKIFPETEIII